MWALNEPGWDHALVCPLFTSNSFEPRHESWLNLISLISCRDPDLVRRIGEATAIEVRATGIPYVFAPCIAVYSWIPYLFYGISRGLLLACSIKLQFNLGMYYNVLWYGMIDRYVEIRDGEGAMRASVRIPNLSRIWLLSSMDCKDCQIDLVLLMLMDRKIQFIRSLDHSVHKIQNLFNLLQQCKKLQELKWPIPILGDPIRTQIRSHCPGQNPACSVSPFIGNIIH